MVYSVKKKELYAYTYTKSILGHALILWLRILNSFLLLLYFFNLLALVLSFSFSFLLFYFVCPLPFSLSSYYILWFFYHFLHPRVGQVLGVLFSLLPLRILEPSILSCKAACSMFRHHLHINAARELVGQHLMRGQQYSQIFVFSHSYPSSDIFSSTLLQGLSEMLPWENDKSTGHLGQKFRGGNRPRARLNPSQTFFTSFRSATFISSFTGRLRILSYPQTKYWVQSFLMQSVYMRLDIGPNLFPMQFEHMGSIGPHRINLKVETLKKKNQSWEQY